MTKISNAVFAGSIFIRQVVSANKLLVAVNNVFESSYDNSVFMKMARSMLSVCMGWLRSAFSHANITRSIRAFVLFGMVNIKEWSLEIAKNMYCGSLFLDAIGRATEDSIWLR